MTTTESCDFLAFVFTPKELIQAATSLISVSARFQTFNRMKDAEGYFEIGSKLLGVLQSQESLTYIFTPKELLDCTGCLIAMSVFFQTHDDDDEAEAYFDLSMKLFGALHSQDAAIADEEAEKTAS